MKRHEKLRRLSREHQKALVVAMALKYGPHPPYQLGWPSDPEKKKPRFLQFADTELLAHLQEEEEQIFPLASAYSPVGRHLCVTLGMEHELMRQLISEIRVAQGPELSELLVDFGLLLEQHIREEERQLFELMPEIVPPFEMAEL
ncbi:MAG: hemerythrin domain-containing protein [Acidobacteria bacterium]|nr:hemerythrin domain-containing protein [Acidobacteriota bacterium]